MTLTLKTPKENTNTAIMMLLIHFHVHFMMRPLHFSSTLGCRTNP